MRQLRASTRTTAASLIGRLAPSFDLAYQRWRDRRLLANVGLVGGEFSLCGPRSFREWRAEKPAFEQLLAGADVCIDVGANIGLYTCLARARDKHVIAIEPLPRNLVFLNRNLKLNGFNDVEVLPLAVGAAPSTQPIYGIAEIASLLPKWSRRAPGQSEQVEVSTLDILFGRRFSGKRLFIKVDVEGFERQVLYGAEQLLSSRPRPTWLIEILIENPMTGAINPDFLDTFKLFWRHGYTSFQVESPDTALDLDTIKRWIDVGSLAGVDHNFIFRDTS